MLGLKITSNPLSHNWLMLSRLCFKPCTYWTFYILAELGLPIIPLPLILSLSLFPNVTSPPSFFSKVRKQSLSPVMCLEQPLSKYHGFVLAPWGRTYIWQDKNFRYPCNVTSLRVSSSKISFLSVTLCLVWSDLLQ